MALINPTDRGNSFSRTELGIMFPYNLRAYYKREEGEEKEEFLFITINNGKYHDELHPDGIVIEPATDKDLQPDSTQDTTQKGMHILVRHTAEGDFEYIGDKTYMTRYDQKRNKIFVE